MVRNPSRLGDWFCQCVLQWYSFSSWWFTQWSMTIAGTSSVVVNSGVGVSVSVCRSKFPQFSLGVPRVEDRGLRYRVCKSIGGLC